MESSPSDMGLYALKNTTISGIAMTIQREDARTIENNKAENNPLSRIFFG
jgi:hypothetical protein